MSGTERYRVVRPLGAGSGGSVYLVEDRVRGGVPLAMKCFEPSSDPHFFDALAREFTVLSSISAPCVAPVYDLGTRLDGQRSLPFFTRAYVAGRGFDEFCATSSLREQLRIFLRVLEAVGALHRLGVVHGDLKPANIIVDDCAEPWLIDFGLASRALEREQLLGSGSPAFMAPELLRGGSPSELTDLYALGATLFSVVTGRSPRAGQGDPLAARLRGELPNIPDGLDEARRLLAQASLAALADDPRARPQGADELAALLERALPEVARSKGPPKAFVAPRLRARGEVLARLEQWLREPDAVLPVMLVAGARGVGKSTVLRELKWRLQLAGRTLVELRGGGTPFSPFVQLLQQTALWPGGEAERSVLVRAQGGLAERNELVDAVVRALGRAPQRAVLLVDDLDAAEAVLGEALRAVLHGDAAGPAPLLVATVEQLAAPGVAGFAAGAHLELGPLPDDDARALIREALGAVDSSAVQAILGRTHANPGALVELLSSLAALPAVTVNDVNGATFGEISGGVAETRLARVRPDARRLLAALAAAGGELPLVFVRAFVEPGSQEGVQAELLHLGYVRSDDAKLYEADFCVGEYLLHESGALSARAMAARMLEHPARELLDHATLARLGLLAADAAALKRFGPQAARELLQKGAGAAAVRLYEAVLVHVTDDPARATELRLSLGEACHALGEYERAVCEAQAVLGAAEASTATRTRAQILSGRAQVAAGKTDRAVAVLSAVDTVAPPALRGEALRELARAYLRRGEHELAKQSVEQGLALAAVEASARAELLAIDGMLESMAGHHEAAQKRYEEALELARKVAAVRDEALALGYAALGRERAGDLEGARREYERSLSAARAAGDLGLTSTYALNLGNVSFRLGATEQAEENYALAGRLSRRAGRTSTALYADNNLAHLHLYMGLYARARACAERVQREAEATGLAFASAQATAILADIDARSGDVSGALSRYDAATSAFKALGRARELAEAYLDAADALLERASGSDLSGAAVRLAEGRSLVDQHGLDDFRVRLRFLLARARAENGDADGASRDLERAEADVRQGDDRELLWQILTVRARVLRSLGSELSANRLAREAAEVIEALATRLPRDAREAFRSDPRRRAALELAAALEGDRQTRSVIGVQTGAKDDRRFERLLEIIKRLASEHDLPRLLERITDAAVELSGAERGFVLLCNEAGELVPYTVRGVRAAGDDPHVAFSHSIAESVLIDGEPIVTTNARDDRRLSEFMSVHRLALKSVAALPIRGHDKTLGVLYLEHRLRAGRFDENDLALLIAFADQAAIALENARLWAENGARTRELEEANAHLRAAKDDIERLLLVRTEELERVKTDLGRAEGALRGGRSYGIVGESQAMRQVLAVVERAREASVPVIICGESGTGKELVARAIHAGATGRKGPFVALNCAALPEALLESELFGHVRGAFTGADRDKKGLIMEAHGGTLFLDELADMPMRMQVDLLRVLQESRVRPLGAEADLAVDVRVIAACRRPLAQLVRERRLREDLYYRLSVIELRLPPLRERKEDIPLLADHFLVRLAKEQGRPRKRLSKAALEAIAKSGLPGNVRQLEHLLTSACMMSEGAVIEADDLPLEGPVAPRYARGSEAPPARLEEGMGTAHSPQELPANDLADHKDREKRKILLALEHAAWNRARAAQALGMPRRTFYRRLEEYGIL